jgi:ribosome maturation factor RimP
MNRVGFIKKARLFCYPDAGLKDFVRMKNTPQEHTIIKVVKPAIEYLGFALVCLEFKSGVLQVMVEHKDGGRVGLDDCTLISKTISPLLEVEDPIPGAYTLEISSPGIDRPLITPEDFGRYIGFEAKLELDMPMPNGQKRFRGHILGTKNGFVGLRVDNLDHTIEIENIRRARLVLTDALIKATKEKLPNTQQQTA